MCKKRMQKMEIKETECYRGTNLSAVKSCVKSGKLKFEFNKFVSGVPAVFITVGEGSMLICATGFRWAPSLFTEF